METSTRCAAPAFADWERRFVELCAKLPEGERAEAMAAFGAAVERAR